MEINLPSGLTKECDFLSVVVVVALAAPESRNMRFAVRSQLTLRAMLPSSRWKSEIYRARDWDTNKSQEFHSPFSDIKLILVLHFSLPFLGLLKSASNDFYSNSRGKIKERGDGKKKEILYFDLLVICFESSLFGVVGLKGTRKEFLCNWNGLYSLDGREEGIIDRWGMLIS